MVSVVRQGYNDEKERFEIVFEYDYCNKNDIALIKKIEELCREQPRCENCTSFYLQGCFGDYRVCYCKIHGCLEHYPNPHYDMDGSKCKDYKRKEV